MIVGFDPIIAEEPRVMILGSMPSVTSLERRQYYGYRHNRFWPILSACFSMPIDTYEQKKRSSCGIIWSCGMSSTPVSGRDRWIPASMRRSSTRSMR